MISWSRAKRHFEYWKSLGDPGLMAFLKGIRGFFLNRK